MSNYIVGFNDLVRKGLNFVELKHFVIASIVAICLFIFIQMGMIIYNNRFVAIYAITKSFCKKNMSINLQNVDRYRKKIAFWTKRKEMRELQCLRLLKIGYCNSSVKKIVEQELIKKTSTCFVFGKLLALWFCAFVLWVMQTPVDFKDTLTFCMAVGTITWIFVLLSKGEVAIIDKLGEKFKVKLSDLLYYSLDFREMNNNKKNVDIQKLYSIFEDSAKQENKTFAGKIDEYVGQNPNKNYSRIVQNYLDEAKQQGIFDSGDITNYELAIQKLKNYNK